MGLIDVLNGMQNGPRGQRDPNQSSGGMSPITMAILGLLAYKAVKHIGKSRADPENALSSSRGKLGVNRRGVPTPIGTLSH